jgi:thiamine pyrophosphokinase
LLQAVIFANGEFIPSLNLDERLSAAELIIAADGGSLHCRTLAIQPNVIIGDLDSMEPEDKAEWQAQGVEIIPHPADKDQTDLELALLHAKAAGAEKITVLAALGRRWDHSVANLMLAAEKNLVDLAIEFLHGEQRLSVIQNEAELDAGIGERVSLIPLRGDATGVTTRGLKYALNRETLMFGSSRGVSNVAMENRPSVKIDAGILLCVISPRDHW